MGCPDQPRGPFTGHSVRGLAQGPDRGRLACAGTGPREGLGPPGCVQGSRSGRVRSGLCHQAASGGRSAQSFLHPVSLEAPRWLHSVWVRPRLPQSVTQVQQGLSWRTTELALGGSGLQAQETLPGKAGHRERTPPRSANPLLPPVAPRVRPGLCGSHWRVSHPGGTGRCLSAQLGKGLPLVPGHGRLLAVLVSGGPGSPGQASKGGGEGRAAESRPRSPRPGVGWGPRPAPGGREAAAARPVQASGLSSLERQKKHPIGLSFLRKPAASSSAHLERSACSPGRAEESGARASFSGSRPPPRRGRRGDAGRRPLIHCRVQAPVVPVTHRSTAGQGAVLAPRGPLRKAVKAAPLRRHWVSATQRITESKQRSRRDLEPVSAGGQARPRAE